ncbi:MFS transporter [Paraburkholderia caffeinitolerans]|nr:MFS transporter [Paraburkholderia caffeinitolerans]
MMANFFDKIVIGLLAVPIMNDLKITPMQFGVLSSSFFWLFAVGGIAGGFIANRIAAKWVLLAMALAWALCQIPLVMSTSLTVFILARVALGLTEGPAYPTAIHAAYKWFPPHKRIVPVALFGTGTGLGLLCAGVLVPLITLRWGWRANFLFLIVFTLAWSALWLIFGKEGKLDDAQPVPGAHAEIPYRRLLADPTVFGSYLMQFVGYWNIALTFTWLPAYLQKGLGCDAVTAGRLYALTLAGGMPLTIGASFVAQRLIARGIPSRIARGWFTAACQVLGGLMLVSLSIPNLPLAAREVAMIVATSLGCISYAICPAILGEVTPTAQRGAVLALGTSIASIAGILSPLIMGRFVQADSSAHGYEIAFLLGGSVLIAGSLIGAMLVNPERSMLRRVEACQRADENPGIATSAAK